MNPVGPVARHTRASSLRHPLLRGFVAGLTTPFSIDLHEVVVASLDGQDVSVAFGRRGWVAGVFTLPDFRNRGAGFAALSLLVQNWPEASCESGSPAGERLVARVGVRDLTLTPERGQETNPRRARVAMAY